MTTTTLRPEHAKAALYAGGAAVVGLWALDGVRITGMSGALLATGRVAGLIAGYAVAVLLLLMARIPALEHGIGADRLARWHSRGGRITVTAMVVHALAITWGYAVEAHAGIAHQTATLLLHYPDLLTATAAFGLFLLVAVISVRAARRRLRYETWYLLHLYTYLAAWLAFGHQLSNGAQLVERPLARALWYSLYLGAAAALVWWRLLAPIRTSLRHRVRVAEVRTEGPGVVSLYLTGRDLDRLGARPGQFFRFRFLTRDGWWQSHPYSLSAAPRATFLRITVKDLGDHSGTLGRLRPGTRAFLEGPYGAMTPQAQAGSKVLLLAGGIGITPLRALFESVPGDVSLLYRVSRPEDAVFVAELEQIAQRRGARVQVVAGHRDVEPLVPGRLRQLVPDVAEREVYLCGPASMTQAAERALRHLGVHRIHVESFAF